MAHERVPVRQTGQRVVVQPVYELLVRRGELRRAFLDPAFQLGEDRAKLADQRVAFGGEALSFEGGALQVGVRAGKLVDRSKQFVLGVLAARDVLNHAHGQAAGPQLIGEEGCIGRELAAVPVNECQLEMATRPGVRWIGGGERRDLGARRPPAESWARSR